MAQVTIKNNKKVAAPVWPVGTVARVRLKGSTKNPNGYLRFHAVVGVPAGANVDADNPATLVNVRHVAINLETGSAKGSSYTIDRYDVLEVFGNIEVSQ